MDYAVVMYCTIWHHMVYHIARPQQHQQMALALPEISTTICFKIFILCEFLHPRYCTDGLMVKSLLAMQGLRVRFPVGALLRSHFIVFAVGALRLLFPICLLRLESLIIIMSKCSVLTSL